ncbi:hypothetical protein SAMN05444521_6353 [Streptomyces sp. 3214.6]|nr:hypothetical protein SAMN05444521_6353 [Streptomyces sp. 3214.6]
MFMPVTGRLLGSGRTADVYEIDEAWVLRRDRDGWGDAAAEGAVMAHVREYGYPAPAVRPPSDGSRTDLVGVRGVQGFHAAVGIRWPSRTASALHRHVRHRLTARHRLRAALFHESAEVGLGLGDRDGPRTVGDLLPGAVPLHAFGELPGGEGFGQE